MRDAAWFVTGEAPLGDYQAVSFVGELSPGTGGAGQMGDGNVALFNGRALKAPAIVLSRSSGARVAQPYQGQTLDSGVEGPFDRTL